MDRCRLCSRDKDLKASHIVPRFVYQWLKRTSSTGYMRFGREVNRRAQDGHKLSFLCGDCEERFNKFETPFANRIFLPYHEQGKTDFTYETWMLQFCVSVSWRILRFMREEHPDPEFERFFSRRADRALTTWNDFLLGRTANVGRYEQHLLPVGPIAASDGDHPPNIQRYLTRAVEIDRIRTQQSAFTYAKLGRLVLVGFICEPESKCWAGTKLSRSRGSIAPRSVSIPDWLVGEIDRRATRLAEIESGMSARQLSRIERDQHSNPERVANSETLAAGLLDHQLTHLGERIPTESEGADG